MQYAQQIWDTRPVVIVDKDGTNHPTRDARERDLRFTDLSTAL
jgi:hypothetical protein